MKNAIIYDKWLSGLGGGEVVACTMATVLRDCGYNVVFACQKKVPIEVIKEKLSVDMKGITFVEVSSEQDLKLISNLKPSVSNLQSPIDLFINLSFMDYSYGFAKKNIYYVHFPSAIRSGLFNYVLLFFQKTNFPFVNTQSKHSLFSNHLKEKINDRLRAGIYIDMRKRLHSYQIIIANSSFTKQWIRKYWNIDAKVLYPPITFICHPEFISGSKNKIPKPLQGQQSPISKHNWICSLGRFFTLGHGKKQEVMIEAFKVLYDSINLKAQISNVKSTNQISNPKSQISNDHQLTTSNQSPTSSLQSPIANLELHLIGGVGKEPSSIRFVETLKEMAKGYPIYFHFNATRNEVEEILLKSKIYWHAAGFGENPEKDPIKFEHFGIAPIEAVSAGCIPILFNGGGLPEIINILQLENKLHTFDSINELVQKTAFHLNENQNFSLSSTLICKFTRDAFSQEFLRLVL